MKEWLLDCDLGRTVLVLTLAVLALAYWLVS